MKKNLFGRFIGTLCVLLLAGTSCHVVDESSGGGTSRPSSSDISSSIPESSVEENYNNLPVLTEGAIDTITVSDLDSISIDAYFFKNGESYRSLTVEYGVSVNTEYALRVTTTIKQKKYRVAQDDYRLSFLEGHQTDFESNPTKIGTYSIEIHVDILPIDSGDYPVLTVEVVHPDNMSVTVADYAYGTRSSYVTYVGIDANEIASAQLTFAPVLGTDTYGEYKTYVENTVDYSVDAGEYAIKADIRDNRGEEFHLGPTHFHVTKGTFVHGGYDEAVYYGFNSTAVTLADYPYSGNFYVDPRFADYTATWKNPDLPVDQDHLTVSGDEAVIETYVVFHHKNAQDLELPVTVHIGMYLSVPTVRNATLNYTGEEQTAIIDGFDSENMEIVEEESTLKATHAGTYSIKIRATGANGLFFGHGEEEVVITWQILKVDPFYFFHISNNINDYEIEVGGHRLERVNNIYQLPCSYIDHGGNHDIQLAVYRILGENERVLLDFDTATTKGAPVHCRVNSDPFPRMVSIDAMPEVEYVQFSIWAAFGGDDSNFTAYEFPETLLRFWVPERNDIYHDLVMNAANPTGSAFGRSVSIEATQNGVEIPSNNLDLIRGRSGDGSLFRFYSRNSYRVLIHAYFYDIQRIEVTTMNCLSADYGYGCVVRVSHVVNIGQDGSNDILGGPYFNNSTVGFDCAGPADTNPWVIKLDIGARNGAAVDDFRYIESIKITYKGTYNTSW